MRSLSFPITIALPFLAIACGSTASESGSTIGSSNPGPAELASGGSSAGPSGTGSSTSEDPFGSGNAGNTPIIVTTPIDPREDEVCDSETYSGQAGIIDMVIMMDRSGSMVGFGAQTQQDLWTPIGSALGDFVARPEAAGMSASIQFFPQPLDAAPLIDMRVCDTALYSAPAAPMGPLPMNGQAIQNAIVANQPQTGGTPTRPALEGAVQYAEGIAGQNPTHKVIIVLATDGDPNDCRSDLNSVSGVAANALDAGIETYVIGIGNITGLNQIAQAGGSGQAIIVDADPAVAATQFLAAMDEIRNRAIPCDYGLPNDAQDPQRVNLLYTPPGATEAQPIPYVESQDRCAVVGGGWYYDNPVQPNRILTCAATCDALLAVKEARVNVQVGCRRIAE